MEVKIVLRAEQPNRINKSRYNKVHNPMPKIRARCGINESLGGISKVMSHLMPNGQPFGDDVNLLEFTVEYLKQTTDFGRGIGFCAEETKSFLKHHIFDRRKINALFQIIEQRIDSISKQPFHTNTQDTLNRQDVSENNQNLVDETTAGVLLDLSVKQNRRQNDAHPNRHNSSSIPSLSNKSKKREILDKIRKKILDKRRMSGTMDLVQKEMMWRPWRY